MDGHPKAEKVYAIHYIFYSLNNTFSMFKLDQSKHICYSEVIPCI